MLPTLLPILLPVATLLAGIVIGLGIRNAAHDRIRDRAGLISIENGKLERRVAELEEKERKRNAHLRSIAPMGGHAKAAQDRAAMVGGVAQ